jgi:proton-dependent oligopeptide transporter, POT family
LNQGVFLSVLWQFVPLIILSIAEILVSITGLEFAYTQAPQSMKSTIMSFWFLTISAGNLFTALISYINPFKAGFQEYLFYTILMFVVSGIFVAMAARYRMRNYVAS